MSKSLYFTVVLAGAMLNHMDTGWAQSSNALYTLPTGADQAKVLVDIPPQRVAAADSALMLIVDEHRDIRDRLQAVQELDDSLNRNEIDSLFGFLRRDSQEKNMAGLRALKNDVINALKEQNSPPVGLTASLIGMFYDPAQDLVIRDYAIQHLGTWYPRSTHDSPDAKERIQSVLKEAIHEKTSIAGTALLALHRLSLGDNRLDGAEIERAAMHLVTASDTPTPTRITAIQICSERGLVQVLPEIEAFAEASGQTSLQISAIAALGVLGNTRESAVLQRLQREGDVALRPAIAEALKRLPRSLVSQSGL